jgi:hypothetical protein
MSFATEFDRYLGLFRLRLKQLLLARGAAAIALAALAITAIAVTLAIRKGFPNDLVIMARLILFGGLAVLAWLLVVRPGRALERDAAGDIEARTPQFGGRVETYLEMSDSANPMRELLAEDTLQIAADHAPETEVRQREFTLALGAAGLALAGLIFLAVAGPGNYAYGVRHLWFGWALPNLLPPQSIAVTPGDDGIRKGGTVAIRATMQGFAPGEAFVHARFAAGEWQQVAMSDERDAFEFTFLSVREPLEYFVSAANVRSPTYTVTVVDLPVVENLVLTYHYPDWTGLQPEVRDPGGDVRAIADTEVEVRIQTDRPMSPGELVVDDQTIDMRVAGNSATATFTVAQDGEYFVAAKVGGEQIRLTDDYFITLLEDELPVIEFSRPGRDWSASSVEEVTASIAASDDFGIESLGLQYSVNGGEWQSIDLPVATNLAEVDHVFFLESLAQDGSGEALVPGDLVAYFAVAKDRQNSARTDIFFIDVQPFDRRYSQSQQAGGGGGGQQENEISQRQKEIVVSTWNLIREQQEQRRDDPAYVADNAALLSRVQSTLRDQVETLSQRTQARQLDASAADIATFVDHLNKAALAMIPAAERLGEIELEQAILPEQEALQHLLAAEAVFTDISVSLQANNRGGGGGQAGRDLTEMFELEMDLEKNQYETGSTAAPEAPQQQLEEAANELEELARRQEQLARTMNQERQATPAQRWQQELLRRDVEKLRDRLERMQQGSASNQSQSQQAQEQQAENAQQGSSGQSSAQSEQQQRDELQRRLESAIRAMNEADDAMQGGASPDELRRAANEAQRQLEGARDRALEEQQQAMQASLEELAGRADQLYDTQSAMEDQLQEAIRGVSVGRNRFERLDSGLTIDEEYEMAAEKRRLQAEVQKLQQDARTTAAQIDETEPGAARQLREAIEDLQDMQVETRISVAADYIEQGEAVYVAASESAVTEALRQLAQDLRRAEGMLRNDGGQQRAGNGIAETLAETQQLRRDLQQAAQGERVGGRPVNGNRDDRPQSTGQLVDDLQVTREFDQQADNISQDILNMFRTFRDAGVSIQDIDELRRLAADVRAADFSGNPELLEEEARHALALVEQLELALARTARNNERSVRSNSNEEVPDEHREIIADYYRRLGQSEESTDQ